MTLFDGLPYSNRLEGEGVGIPDTMKEPRNGKGVGNNPVRHKICALIQPHQGGIAPFS
jgi:hypothetical protein